MKKIKLTQGQFALVDDRDYCYLSQWKWCSAFDKTTNSYYAIRADYSELKIKTVRMHRVILCNPKLKVDHINHNTLDNQRDNLRVVDNSESKRNSTLYKNNISGFCGVTYRENKKKWIATLRFKGKDIYLGWFDEKEDAIKARKIANIKYGFNENHGCKKPNENQTR